MSNYGYFRNNGSEYVITDYQRPKRYQLNYMQKKSFFPLSIIAVAERARTKTALHFIWTSFPEDADSLYLTVTDIFMSKIWIQTLFGILGGLR